ncbi:hypothetical protein EV424DRAFT_1547601 [Suillus variegatus]|nr:hypothetical protein EV424DRAFT_1547601 [Suillus variegatus]
MIASDNRGLLLYCNHVPWAVIGACCIVCPVLLLIIRAILVRENKICDAGPVDDEEQYVIERITEDGKRVEVKVDKGLQIRFITLTMRHPSAHSLLGFLFVSPIHHTH